MKTFRFRHFSISLNWVLVLAFLVSAVVGADAILTTIDNVRNAAPWWHTAFTAVESLVFLTATVCCILKALQPHRPGRFRFYHTVALLACLFILVRQAFFAYESLFLDVPIGWIGFSSLYPSPGGPYCFTLSGDCATRTEKGSKKQFEQRINRMI